jgi:hypothetical protein
MQIRLGVVLISVITVLVGAITVLGLLLGDSIIGGEGVFANILLILSRIPFADLASVFLRLSVLMIAVTILAGMANLIFVHFGRLRQRDLVLSRKLFSFIFVLVYFGTIAVYASSRTNGLRLLDDVQVALESAFAGLLFFALVYGAVRIMRREVTLYRLLFVLTLLLVLLAALPFPGLGIVSRVYNWVMAVPVEAGAKGILLGIALATLLTGVRVLVGQDRSYGQ